MAHVLHSVFADRTEVPLKELHRQIVSGQGPVKLVSSLGESVLITRNEYNLLTGGRRFTTSGVFADRTAVPLKELHRQVASGQGSIALASALGESVLISMNEYDELLAAANQKVTA